MIESGRLHNLVQIVVEVIRQSRRAGGGGEAEQASLAERTALGIVVGAGRLQTGIAAFLRVGSRPRAFSRQTCPGFRVVRRYAAIGRIDHDRRPDLSIHNCVVRAGIEPERVVAAHTTRSAGRTVTAFGRSGTIAFDGLVTFVLLIGDQLFETRRLFLGQHGVHSGWPLDRRDRGEIVSALEVGMTVGQTRNGIRFRGRFRRLTMGCKPNCQGKSDRDGSVPHNSTSLITGRAVFFAKDHTVTLPQTRRT